MANSFLAPLDHELIVSLEGEEQTGTVVAQDLSNPHGSHACWERRRGQGSVQDSVATSLAVSTVVRASYLMHPGRQGSPSARLPVYCECHLHLQTQDGIYEFSVQDKSPLGLRILHFLILLVLSLAGLNSCSLKIQPRKSILGNPAFSHL